MLVKLRVEYLWPRYERIAYTNEGYRYKRDTTTILIITLLIMTILITPSTVIVMYVDSGQYYKTMITIVIYDTSLS